MVAAARTCVCCLPLCRLELFSFSLCVHQGVALCMCTLCCRRPHADGSILSTCVLLQGAVTIGVCGTVLCACVLPVS